ncbi:MTOR-associated protein MEAK7-like isoform X1 [Tubulanus polymorphus]|uniref:MTOR-associated protein MEAK7-like isoform X1 n=1 Tax=Tubulanus polymorphus TaxID=672921 RepID=UPI003DA432AE
MGLMQSYPEVDRALELFTKQEQDQIRKIFKEIAGENSVSFSRDDLERYLKDVLPPSISTCLHNEMCNILVSKSSRTHHTHVDEKSFVVSLTYLLKGTLSQRSEVFMSITTVNTTATLEQLEQTVQMLLDAYVKLMMKTPQYATWKIPYDSEKNLLFAKFLMHSLVFNADGSPLKSEDVYTLEDLENWISKSAFISHLMDYIFYTCFNVSYVEDMTAVAFHTPKIPFCSDVDWNSTKSLLDVTSLICLNHSIPKELGVKWRLLFSTATDGESFSTMVKYITNEGPTMLIIKDKDGYLFGGFAATPWEISPEWVGTTRCFLFTLFPQIGRFFPSGYNDHYQYLNQGQQTMPNGLGMGGQLDHFGLWIDSEFGIGNSKALPKCTTYNSPQLSKEPNFAIEVLEVWGVGEAPARSKKVTSVLDKDPSGKALLNLAGKQMASEGLRSTDATAESPEEHSLPAM